MPSIKSRVPMTAFLMAMGLSCSGCASAGQIRIPDSLRAPCVSTVDVSEAQTVGDLGKAVIAGDGDLRVCSIQKDAVVAIAESGDRPWWRSLVPG